MSGVSGFAGHELAGVLYAGGELTDLDRDALGGFWSVVTHDDFATTEVVRQAFQHLQLGGVLVADGQPERARRLEHAKHGRHPVPRPVEIIASASAVVVL